MTASAMSLHARRYFFGGCAVGVGAWELTAFAADKPTITRLCRKHKRLRLVWVTWLLAVGYHLWNEEQEMSEPGSRIPA